MARFSSSRRASPTSGAVLNACVSAVTSIRTQRVCRARTSVDASSRSSAASSPFRFGCPRPHWPSSKRCHIRVRGRIFFVLLDKMITTIARKAALPQRKHNTCASIVWATAHSVKELNTRKPNTRKRNPKQVVSGNRYSLVLAEVNKYTAA